MDGSSDAKQDAESTRSKKPDSRWCASAVADNYDLGQEFFRWEIATAVAGSIIGINAFNQPDVEASKIETRKLTDEYEKSGSLPAESPFFEGKGVKLFTDDKNAAALKQAVGGDATSGRILARAPESPEGRRLFRSARLHRTKRGASKRSCNPSATPCATRSTSQPVSVSARGFLHSTGQAYKGGPNSGVFLQITCDDAADLPVPGQKYTFGIVKAAQARGDFQVLAERDRRALARAPWRRSGGGLKTLQQAIQQALS